MRITVFGATGGTGVQVVHQALTQGHHVTAVVRDPSRLVLPTDPASLHARGEGARTASDSAAHSAGAHSVSGSTARSAGARTASDSGGRSSADSADVGSAGVASSSAGVGSGRAAGGFPGVTPAGTGVLEVVVADVLDPAAIEDAIGGADAVVSALGHRRKDSTTVCEDGIASVLRAARASGTRRIIMVSAAGAFIDDGDGPVTRYLVKPILGRLLRDAFADTRAAEARLGDAELDWTIVRPPMLTDKPWTGTYRVSPDRNVRGGRSIARADLADYLLRAIPDATTIRHTVAVAY